MRVLQVNLQHSKAASALLTKNLIAWNVGVALIQEPYVVHGKVAGLAGAPGSVLYDRSSARPRTCIFVKKDVEMLPMWDLTCGDLTVATVNLEGLGGGREVTLASCYLPYEDTEAPTAALTKLVDHAVVGRRRLVIGMDSNAHHTVWGSTDVNRRGESLLDFLSIHNLVIVNQGKEPTFVTRNRREVLDITVTSSSLLSKVSKWRVSQEASLSDHRYILFDIGPNLSVPVSYRNPRRADWSLYREELSSGLEGYPETRRGGP